MSTFWLILKAVLTILPAIIDAVQKGKIQTATLDEVEAAFAAKHQERIAAAEAAKTGELTDEENDPNNRARNRPIRVLSVG